jgi:hypothetical protein
MLDTFNFANPQTCNYQEFYGGGLLFGSLTARRDWIKPRGVAMVRMLLIGAGAGGRAGSTTTGGAGGGSGGITTWIGPAIFIPDELTISIGAGGSSGNAGGNTEIIYQQKDTAGYSLLQAFGAPSSTGAGVGGGGAVRASGIVSFIAGQNGAASATAITASTTTFLSGGAGGAASVTASGGNVASKYGYPNLLGGTGTNGGAGRNGYFMTQPLLLGTGGSGGGGRDTAGIGGAGGRGGIGCGGGGGGRGASLGGSGGTGGDGAVFIWSW